MFLTMYQGFWQNQICQQFFDVGIEAAASDRNSEALVATIFPNPVQDVLHVNLQASSEKPVTLQLTNQYGQVVKNLTYPALANELLKIPVTDLPNGWYYLTMQMENRFPVTKKIMVGRLY